MATLTKDLPPFSSNEDDSLKRNTDCVYFLASPLTCKKGSECEFRHSESARNNPRDCWYWLNGSCLNPKCAFRHPPLDGLVPPQAANTAGPLPPVPPTAPPALAAKQAVPCIFFQQGFCLKGDRCPFLHGPVPLPKTKIWPNPATTPATEAPVLKKTFGGPEKFAQTKMGFHLTAPKAVEGPRRPQPHGAPKVATARLIQETPNYKEIASSPVDSVSLRSRGARLHHPSLVDDKNHQHIREVDDSLRESSPGFDVLVDDKLRKDEYYDDEENYVRTRGQKGRKTDEYDMGRHGHHNSMADVDLDSYRSKRGYNSYNGSQDEYARAQRGASSERPTAHDRRGPYKSESSDFIQNSSDLRYRLSKQRRGNGLQSVVSSDYKPDYLPEDRGYRNSQRDARSPVHDRPVSSRLQGRIKLPRRSPPLSGADMYLERDNEKGRNTGRSSPTRSQVSSHQGRLRDRLNGRIHDESNERRIFRGRMGNDSNIQTNGVELAVPRRLSEIRGANRIDNKPQQVAGQQLVSGGKLRDTALASSLGTESAISFDGPKPLSEILKRKRNAGAIASTNVVNFDDKEGIIQNESDINLISSATNSAVDTGKQVAPSSASEQSQGDLQENKTTVTAEGDEEEGEISNKKVKLIEDEFSLPNDEKHPEEEGDLFGGDGEEHEVDEEYDQGDGEYDYEQDDDVEGYNLNEEEIDEGGDALDTVDNEDFMDEDDGDDFAKKLGVSF